MGSGLIGRVGNRRGGIVADVEVNSISVSRSVVSVLDIGTPPDSRLHQLLAHFDIEWHFFVVLHHKHKPFISLYPGYARRDVDPTYSLVVVVRFGP